MGASACAVGLGDLLADQLLAHGLEDVGPADAALGELGVLGDLVAAGEQLLEAAPHVVVVDLDAVTLGGRRVHLRPTSSESS